MNDLFFDIINRHRLTFKELANDNRFRFHVCERTVRKYASGDIEIPTWAWAALYDISADPDCFRAIAGESVRLIAVPLDENSSDYAHRLRLVANECTSRLEKLAEVKNA